MIDPAALARVQARAVAAQDNKAAMRQQYPKHAALADWARAGGLDVAAVTVDNKTFGKPLPDAKPKWLLLTASEIPAMLALGRISYAGQIKDKRARPRLFGNLAIREETDGDV